MSRLLPSGTTLVVRGDNFEVREVDLDTEDTFSCMKLFISGGEAHIDSIRFSDDEKGCTVPGHKLLQFATSLKKFGIVRKVTVQDAAHILVGGKHPLMLTRYHKFVKGVGWYEKAGFASPDADENEYYEHTFRALRTSSFDVVRSLLLLILAVRGGHQIVSLQRVTALIESLLPKDIGYEFERNDFLKIKQQNVRHITTFLAIHGISRLNIDVVNSLVTPALTMVESAGHTRTMFGNVVTRYLREDKKMKKQNINEGDTYKLAVDGVLAAFEDLEMLVIPDYLMF